VLARLDDDHPIAIAAAMATAAGTASLDLLDLPAPSPAHLRPALPFLVANSEATTSWPSDLFQILLQILFMADPGFERLLTPVRSIGVRGTDDEAARRAAGTGPHFRNCARTTCDSRFPSFGKGFVFHPCPIWQAHVTL
jgi:hypothetical protein